MRSRSILPSGNHEHRYWLARSWVTSEACLCFLSPCQVKLPNMTVRHPGEVQWSLVRSVVDHCSGHCFCNQRAWYTVPCPKTCHGFQVFWDCLSGCKYGGTIPLAERAGSSEFPQLLEDTQVTGSSWEWRCLPCGGGQQASTCSDR